MSDENIRGGKNRVLHKARVSPERWTTAKRQTFLDALADSCNVRQSARAVGMSLPGLYKLRRTDPVFANHWEAALRIGYERLEESLLRQTLIGVNAIEIGGGAPSVPKVLSGDEVKLAMFLLNRYRATMEGEQGRKPSPRRRASSEEVDAALTVKLDALAKRMQRGE
jgi:hypothetical protein